MNKKVPVYFALFMIACLLVSAQPVSAGGEDAQMGDAEFTAVPGTQGQGGHITLEVAIPFFAGCCYPLYAYDVSATLDTPMIVETVSGPEPAKYSKVEAKAGGAPSWATITWVVKSMVAGTHQIAVNVNTENCGTQTVSTTITVTEGCVISIPEVYPEQAATNRDIYINVEALSPIEGVIIESVELYFVVSDKELSSAESKEDTLYYGSDGSKKGESQPMTAAEGEDFLWEGNIPTQTSTSFVHYWVVATDNSGKSTTSPVYVIEVEDLEYVDLVLALTIWLPIILAILGSFIVMTLISMNRRVDSKSKGLLVLGSSKISEPDAVSHIDTKSRRRASIRVYAVSGIFVILGAVILLWAVMGEELQDLVYVMGGGL